MLGIVKIGPLEAKICVYTQKRGPKRGPEYKRVNSSSLTPHGIVCEILHTSNFLMSPKIGIVCKILQTNPYLGQSCHSPNARPSALKQYWTVL